MAYYVHDIHPNVPALPGEAEQIEEVRRQLIWDSDRIRLGEDPSPRKTTAHLARSAINLASSRASLFGKLHTLNIAHANLLAGGVGRYNMRVIAGLSRKALEVIDHPNTNNQVVNGFYRTEAAARRQAIKHTTPDFPFPDALEEAWGNLGHPIGPLIESTEEIVLEFWRAKAREKRLTQETGALPPFDPFADDEEEDDTPPFVQ